MKLLPIARRPLCHDHLLWWVVIQGNLEFFRMWAFNPGAGLLQTGVISLPVTRRPLCHFSPPWGVTRFQRARVDSQAGAGQDHFFIPKKLRFLVLKRRISIITSFQVKWSVKNKWGLSMYYILIFFLFRINNNMLSHIHLFVNSKMRKYVIIINILAKIK